MLNNALLKTLVENNLHHFRDWMNWNVPDLFLNSVRHDLLLYLIFDLHLWNFLYFHLFMRRLETYDGTVAIVAGCLNLAVREGSLHPVSDMAGR